MKIVDLLTLDDFMRAVATDLPGINFYLPLSNGEKAVDEISAYYTDDYAGTTVFFQVAESHRNKELVTFLCSLTIATKPDDVGARAGLEARNLTFRLMMQLLGKLQLAAENAVFTVEETDDMYDLIINQVSKVFPIGLLANVNLEGHYVDLDVTVPANHLLYKEPEQ